jgi:hypothetical protein
LEFIPSDMLLVDERVGDYLGPDENVLVGVLENRKVLVQLGYHISHMVNQSVEIISDY